jgi:hypothetical protein
MVTFALLLYYVLENDQEQDKDSEESDVFEAEEDQVWELKVTYSKWVIMHPSSRQIKVRHHVSTH